MSGVVGTGARVLVVDDQRVLRSNLRGILEAERYAVTEAASAEEALRAVSEASEPFDVVLTDILMGGMSGLNLLKHLKEVAADTEVVIMTGMASIYTAVKALRLGAYDYLIKPLDEAEVVRSTVHRALERRRLLDENRMMMRELKAKNEILQGLVGMLKALNDTSIRMAASREVGEILRLMVEAAARVLGAARATLWMPDRRTGEMTPKAALGVPLDEARSFHEQRGAGPLAWAAAHGVTLAVGGPEDLPPGVAGGLEPLHPAPLVVVPLRAQVGRSERSADRVIALLAVSGRAGGERFSEADLGFLTNLARSAAVAIEGAGLIRELKLRTPT